jgi:hypothetical protein
MTVRFTSYNLDYSVNFKARDSYSDNYLYIPFHSALQEKMEWNENGTTPSTRKIAGYHQ